jgi:predicted  nucleic acid-binding Zn-ribbon protein
MKRISLNKVMAKLAEQPEKVEKVELSLVADYDALEAKYNDSLTRLYDDVAEDYSQTLKDVSKLKSKIEDRHSNMVNLRMTAEQMLDDANKIYQKIESASKDLGIDVPSDVVKEQRGLEALRDDALNFINRNKKYYESITSAL